MSVTKILLLLFLVFLWTLMIASPTWASLVLGIILSLACVALFVAVSKTHIHPSKDFIYPTRKKIITLPIRVGYAIVFLPFLFLEIMVSAIRITTAVMKPESLKPGIIRCSISLSSPFSIAILANLITLTPGTMSIDYVSSERVIFIHALDLDSKEKVRQVLAGANTFEEWVRRIFE